MNYVKADFMIADSGKKIKPRRKLPLQPAQKGACAFLLRRVDDLLGRSLLHDAPAVHEYYAVGDHAGKLHFMRDDHHRHLLFGERADDAQHLTSGSSALVGSSKKSSSGFMQSARAMAARCCCPPESWQG